MSRKLLIPAIVAASVAFTAGSASAGTVFDFVPRMDFYDQPELVQKDKSDVINVCIQSSSEAASCGEKAKADSKTLREDTDK